MADDNLLKKIQDAILNNRIVAVIVLISIVYVGLSDICNYLAPPRCMI